MAECAHNCKGHDPLPAWLSVTPNLPSLTTTTQGNPGHIISEPIRALFETANYVILGTVVGVAGVLGNCFSIIVFLKQGLQDSVTISLLALALSDLFVDFTFTWLAVCYNPLFIHSSVNVMSNFAHQYIVGWPHVFFARLTSCFTVYITLERCLCVVWPLHVKRLLTPTTTLVILLSIFSCMALLYSLVYWGIHLRWTFDSASNRTLLNIVFTENRQKYDDVAYAGNSAVQCITFILVAGLTAKLVHSLQKQSEWRAASGASAGKTGPQTVSSKDRRVVRLVVFISIVLIVTSVPALVTSIVSLCMPEIAVGRKYHNTHFVLWSFNNLFAAVNSSINVFLYYTMSSNFRSHAQALLCGKEGSS